MFKDAVKIALRRMSTRGRNEQKMQEEHPIDQGGEELAIEQPVQYDEVVENLIRPFLINEIAERVPDVEDLYDIQVAEEYLDLNVSPKPEGNLDQTCFPARFVKCAWMSIFNNDSRKRCPSLMMMIRC